MSNQRMAKPATGTSTVTVICKIPQGLLLQLHEQREVTEVTLGGHRTVKQFFPVDDPIHINGPAHEQDKAPRCRTVGGYAITEGVPEDKWKAWMDQTGRYLPAVKNRLLMALPDINQAVDAAKEHGKLKSGLERLNPNELPSLSPLFQVKTAEEQVADIRPEE